MYTYVCTQYICVYIQTYRARNIVITKEEHSNIRGRQKSFSRLVVNIRTSQLHPKFAKQNGYGANFSQVSTQFSTYDIASWDLAGCVWDFLKIKNSHKSAGCLLNVQNPKILSGWHVRIPQILKIHKFWKSTNSQQRTRENL